MKNFKMKSVTMAVCVFSLLSGCAATKEANDTYSANRAISVNNFTGAQPKSSVAVADPRQPDMGNFGKVQKNWVNPMPLPKIDVNTERARLPEFFKKSVSITMPGRVSLIEALSELQRSNKIRFDISQDIYFDTNDIGNFVVRKEDQEADSNQASTNPQTGQGQSNGVSELNAKIALAKETAANRALVIDDFVYRGTLEGALDLLSSKANISWSWTGSEIKIFRYEVKSYNISALAGNTSITSTSTVGSSVVNRTSALTTWSEVKPYLLSMLSSKGLMSVMESSGLVTIKDTPIVQKRVATAVKDLNALISKQVYLNINVYSITRNSGDDYGVDWNLAWNTLGQLTGRSGLNLAVESASGSTANNSFTAGVTSGPFAQSSVVLKALSTLGKASVVNEFSITTLNGQPTPINNEKLVTYVSEVKTEVDNSGDTPVTIQQVSTAKLSQGLNMNLTPKIEANGKVLLEYALTLNDIEKIDVYTTPGALPATIQLPTTTLKNVLQRASLRSGQTLVLSGFKQMVSSNTNNGIGSPNNMLLGGRNLSNNQEQYLVITVTPYIAEDNNN